MGLGDVILQWKTTKPPLPSVREEEFRQAMLNKGLIPTKRGWPDFCVFDTDGRLVAAVEVKERGDAMSPFQWQVANELARYGVPVYLWNPDRGYVRIRYEKGWRGAWYQWLHKAKERSGTRLARTAAELLGSDE